MRSFPHLYPHTVDRLPWPDPDVADLDATADIGAGTPERMCHRAVAWLARHLSWFDDRVHEILPRGSLTFAPMLELLVLARCLAARPRLGHQDFVRTAADLASSRLEDPSFRTGLIRVDATFRFHVWFLAALADLGHVHHDLNDLAQALFDADAGVDSPVRPPAARGELCYAATLGGFRHRLPDPEPLWSAVVFGSGAAEPFTMTDLETYALTHAYFYLTDFGRRPYRLPGDPEAAAARVRTLLGRYLCRNNLDITAELMFCAHVLGRSGDPLMAVGWRRLAAAQRADGSVPGGYYPVPAGTERSPASGFLATYHATLVTALLCAVVAV